MKQKIIKTNDEIVTNPKKTVRLGFTTTQGTTPKGITLIALVITTIFSYDEKSKFSNNKGFLLKAI